MSSHPPKNSLLRWPRGLLAGLFFILNTVFWTSLMIPWILAKIVFMRSVSLRAKLTSQLVCLADCWVGSNVWAIGFLHRIHWKVEGLEGLSPDKSYLVVSNHQSWTDIVILQTVLRGHIPFLRFFLKKELSYVPFLGMAWWALDYPFMSRFSKEYLEKHPEMRGQDLIVTRKACERFRGSPVSILNFLEGTRFEPKKWGQTTPTYRHLLTPKRGGVAFVLQAMGDQFECLLDVSIFYPQESKSLWNFLCGDLDEIVVRLRQVPIPKTLVGEKNLEVKEDRALLRQWVHDIWAEKDRWLDLQKGLLGVCFLILSSGVLSCTQKSEVKGLAEKAAPASFERFLSKEADEGVQGKEALKLNYVSVIKGQSEIEILSTEIQGEADSGLAVVQVRALTVPDVARKTLLEVIAQRESQNSFSLNIGDALSLIRKKLNLKPEAKSEHKFTLTYVKTPEGWTLKSDTLDGRSQYH